MVEARRKKPLDVLIDAKGLQPRNLKFLINALSDALSRQGQRAPVRRAVRRLELPLRHPRLHQPLGAPNYRATPISAPNLVDSIVEIWRGFLCEQIMRDLALLDYPAKQDTGLLVEIAELEGSSG